MNQPFTGFSPETTEFFMAIRFNNNREFFHSNHDWYERAVRHPLLGLLNEVQYCVRGIDPEIDTRPVKTISHINRDVRYSRDKSPYRDYMWMHFNRPSDARDEIPGFYFEIGIEGIGCGMGVYYHNKPLMNALRYEILRDPKRVQDLIAPLGKTFHVHCDQFKRMKIPDMVPENLRPWYIMKGFSFGCECTDEALIQSPAVVDWLIQRFEMLAPMYHFLNGLTPIDDMPDDPTELLRSLPDTGR